MTMYLICQRCGFCFTNGDVNPISDIKTAFSLAFVCQNCKSKKVLEIPEKEFRREII